MSISFPFRYQLAAALVGLNIIGTATLAGFAYRESRNSLYGQAVRSVGVVAEARDEALVQLLVRRQQRMDAFLQSLESLCAERAPWGSFGWENECVRVALTGFQTAESASAVELQYRGRRLAIRGSWPGEPVAIEADAEPLAQVSGAGGLGDYTMQSLRGHLGLRVRFPIDDIDGIFQDRSGLEANGEVFLTDANGHLLTGARYQIDPDTNVLDGDLHPCREGTPGQSLGPDYRGTLAISGFRPVPAVGGGCIVANLQYADALVPIHRLARWFILASTAFIFAGAVISLIVARAVTKPIARLAGSARALEAGQFEHSVPVAGPSEVRQLGRALSKMSQSLGDLVRREHDARLAAETANRTKDDFLAMVSHELRTPLNAILGWASIMLNHQGDDRVASRGLQAVERSARTQARLIDELLDVSSIVRGQLRLNIAAEVSMTAIVEAALEAVRPTADARHLEIVTHLNAPGAVVAGDAGRLQQVVGNLLSNAVRFNQEGGRIEITITTTGETVEIRVADSGLGISPEFLPHVFERFRQADTSATRSHGGLGLGLAIVRHLVELHGGTVKAESAGLGCGATFIVRLPLSAAAPASTAQERPAGSAAAAPLLEGTRVLVVDDDPETRDVLRAMLEDAGASVNAIGSAAETREFLAHTEADLLIADLGMPREDGYSLIRSVRALESLDAARMPAIALSAHARPEDVEHALASGFQMHLAKPIDSSQLLSAIASTLIQA